MILDKGNLVLIRHGEGTHNIESLYNSNPSHENYRPADLTPKGREQVAECARDLKEKGFCDENISLVVVSPLPRTKQTVEILRDSGLFSKKKVKVDPRVIEVQMGDREGHPYFHYTKDSWDHSGAEGYNGESDEQVKERMLDLYRELMLQSFSGSVLVVTHGTPAKMLIEYLTGEPKKLKTAGFSILPWA